MAGPCPTPERLAAALRGLQRADDDAALAAHVADCPACQAQLEALAGGSGWLEAKAKTHATSGLTDSKPLNHAMQELESHLGIGGQERPPPPKLDFLQPSNQPGLLGRFGPYEVLEHIASGGMGIVLKARDAALNRIVAVKILPPVLAANPLARARFVREARAAAAVVHDHVVPIYAVDEFAGLPYIVMQLVQGRTLAERIRATRPLRLEEILRIGAQTAAGLAAAHAQGLTHRDVKPGNILLENSVERVKLTDFGLARAVDDAGLTRTGELAGTPEFMSPEQAGNEPVDHRSDLFSFGSVLYAMCTGCSPFQAGSVIAAVRKVCDELPPPVHEINSTIPRWLSDVIARLMAKLPTERFQSAREVGDLLERYLARVQHGDLNELPGAGAHKGAVRSRGLKLAYAAATLLAIVALLVFVLKSRRGTIAPTPSPPTESLHDPFRVRTAAGASVSGFQNIEDALAAAPSGGVIELCWNGRRDIGAVKLPPKPLILRAGRGFRPFWFSPADAAPALSASAALTLEGIRFFMPSVIGLSRGSPHEPARLGPADPRLPPAGLALLAITNGALRVTHCIFDISPRGTPARACIILANVNVCHIESTLLFAPDAKAVIWQQDSPGGKVGPTAQLTITNCVAMTGEAFWLNLRESSRARIEIARCTFNGAEIFYLPPSFTMANLEVNSRQNVFDSEFLIFDARNPAVPPMPQWLRWRERENLFSPTQRYIVGATAGYGPARLEDWNRWWNQSGDSAREVEVAYASGRGDRNRIGGPRASAIVGFQITELNVTEGPPLPRDQWSRFGADIANVGPAAAR